MQDTFRYETEDFLDGVVVSKRNISTRFTLNESSLNISAGGYDGLGPRFGTAPLPYHGWEQTVSTAFDVAGLITSEGALSGTHPNLTQRRKFLGILSLNTRLNDGFSDPSEQRAYVFFNQDSYDELKVSVPGTKTTNTISPNYAYNGYSSFPSGTPTVIGTDFTRNIPSATLSTGLDSSFDSFNDLVTVGKPSAFWRIGRSGSFMDLKSQAFWSRLAFLTISGQEYRIDTLIGFTSPSRAPIVNSPGNDRPGDVALALTGNPNDQFYEITDFDDPQNISFFLLEDTGSNWNVKYSFNFQGPSGFNRSPTKDFMWRESNYGCTDTGTATLVSGPTTTSIDAIYIYDRNLKHRSSYRYFGIATGKKQVMCIWRDDAASLQKKAINNSTAYADTKVEFFDANKLQYFSPQRVTFDANAVTPTYQENGSAVTTVWLRWPNYTSGTASTMPTPLIELGAANTGLLRANTDYEFTFAVLDKTIGYETNVGVPAKLRTGATDFVNISFSGARVSAGQLITASTGSPFVPASDSRRDPNLHNINFLDYRVYYRELGTFEWLPAGQISKTEALFGPEDARFIMCDAPIASLPGGQPGGFIDYSPLPEANYIDTVAFQNRSFWLSPSALHFSLRNNPFAYPVRNAVPCPKGTFKGMIAHTYPGEAEQSSRLVIFGSQETYAGRFVVGAEQEQRVRIGPDDAATFPVDGSNFIVDAWTSNTSFSGRSAVVAEGVLYFWGPQGIYRDDGVRLPTKISDNLEPWIDSIFDANNTDKIHAIYSAQTDEVVWFYQPEAVSGNEQASKALVFHTKTEIFYPWEFSDLVIDDSQIVEDVVTDSDSDGLSGSRVVITVRDPDGTTSRPMFFDEVTYACDMDMRSMYMVKEVTHPSATTRRLIFADGPATLFPKVGKAIVQSYEKYTGQSVNPNGIYTITGNGVNYIEVERIGASNDFPAQTYAEENYFPVWIQTEHGFTVRMQSQFWAPGGLKNWLRWLHCHTTFQVELLTDQPANSYTLNTKYFSLQGTDNSATSFSLSDNSRGNCQILDSIPFDKDNATGQALKYEWSYNHIGGRWSMQYIAFDCQNDSLGNLKIWQPA